MKAVAAQYILVVAIPMKGMLEARRRVPGRDWELSMRRLVALFVFLACVIAIIRPACAGEDGIVVYSYPANAGPINPHMYSPNQMYAQEMIYEPLVALGDDGRIRPCLAERWEVSEDGLVYTFHLRRDVRFSDGAQFDAHAVARNFGHILANRARHAWLELANAIASHEAVDDFTFRLTLSAPYYPTLEDLSLPRPFRFLSPNAFPDDGITRDGIKFPVGTGPWRLAETRLGEFDRFVPNELYWGDKPVPAGVLVKIIPDPVSRALALQTGEIDLVLGQGQIGFDTFAAMRADPAYATGVSRPVGTMAVAINSARTPTDDLRVRQAIQHLVDKDALIDGVFLGAQPRADFLFSSSVPYADIGLTPYRYDIDEANRLLDAAGWTLEPGQTVRTRDGLPLVIDYCFVGNDAAQKAAAEVLQGMAARAGILLNLVGEEEDSYYRRQKDGNFGMIVNPTWGPPFEPHAMLGSMRSASHADYQAQLGLPMKARLDAAITSVMRSVDEAERAALYRDILTTLHEQAVYLPLHYAALLSVHRPDRLEGVHFGPGKSKYLFEDFRKKD